MLTLPSSHPTATAFAPGLCRAHHTHDCFSQTTARWTPATVASRASRFAPPTTTQSPSPKKLTSHGSYPRRLLSPAREPFRL